MLTPRHLLRHLNSLDITEWIAYYRIEPFGGMHDEHLAGVIASTIANCHRSKDQIPFLETDYMPNYITQEMTPDEMRENYYAWKGVTRDVDC